MAGRSHITAPLLLSLVEGLPDESRTVAAIAGNAEFRGWSKEARLLADLFDAVQANTMASGNWKNSPPKLKPYPRPAHRKRRMTTLADIKAMAGR